MGFRREERKGGGGEFLKGEIGKVSSFSTWDGRRGREGGGGRGTGRNICPVSAFYGGYVKGEKLYI